MKRPLPRGFTLVELMISMAVLAFVLLAFMSVMNSSAALSMSSKEGSIAAFELQSAVEDVYGIDYVTDLVPNGPRSAATTPPSGSPPTSFPPTVANASSALPPYNLHVPAAPGTSLPPGTRYAALKDELITFKWAKIGDIDPASSIPTWVEFEVDITWTNYKGKTQTDLIVARRSR